MESTILDGAMGSELLRRANRPSADLWSAHALLEAPELVTEVHRAYIDAGARVITTNTYSTIPSYLGKAGLEDRYLELAANAGRLARAAADATPGVRVAASLPPLDESYRPDLVPADAEAAPVYEALAETLAPFADLFLCETMSSIREARNAAAAARRTARADQEIWVALTLNERSGEGLRSGESVADAYAALADLEIDAWLFNCTSPEAIGAAVAELRPLTDKPIGAYANRFVVPQGWTLDNEIATTPRELSVTDYVAFARNWQAAGVSIIGGCCGIGPDYIEALSTALEGQPAAQGRR